MPNFFPIAPITSEIRERMNKKSPQPDAVFIQSESLAKTFVEEELPDLMQVRKTAKPGTIDKSEVGDILAISGLRQPTGLRQALTELREEVRAESRRLKTIETKINTILKSVVRTEWENSYVS